MTILKRYLTRHGDIRSVYKVITPSCRFFSTTTPIHQSAPAKQPISLTQSKSQIDKIDYEPLPRSLSPSRGLLLLSIPIPPKNWPARLEMASGLLSSTTKATKQYNVSVNMVHDSTGSETDFPLKVEKESYPGRLSFHDGKVFDFPRFNIETLTSEKFLKSLEYRPGPVLHDPDVVKEVYVCTHGSRDCRCSERGGDLVDTLREQVKVRGLHDSIRIGEIAHVGGHKYAANAITLPSLDMFSNLSTSHAEKIIDHLVNPSNSNEIWQNWRGRYGMTEKEQSNVWSRVDPDKQGSRKEVENLRVDLRFKTWDGDLRDVKADIGETLLQVAKRHDLPSMEGTCGGNLECATCHCYLPKSPPIPSPLDEEFDMLGYAVGYRDGESRLGCQIKVTPELAEWVKNGGVIGLPRF